jgi:hypothetical protein
MLIQGPSGNTAPSFNSGGNFPVANNADLSFGGSPDAGFSSVPLTFGNGGGGQVNTYDTSPSLFGQMFGGGSQGGGGSRPTTVNTAQVDGSTGFISGLSERLGGILGAIGSTGDGPATGQQVPVQYRGASTGGGLDGATILGVLAVAGVVYVLSTQGN